jgi:hemoglobin
MTRQTLLVELGGADGVAATVDDLYRRLLRDPDLAPYFAGVDVARVRAHMTDFLVAALDGPEPYAGRDLVTAHGRLRVTDDAFDATASHLLDALEDRSVRPDLLDAVLDRVAALRASVVTAR